MKQVHKRVERPRRDAVLLRGCAVLRTGRRIAVEVHDLGQFGCRVQTDECLAPNEPLRLVAPPLNGLSATVRWASDDTAGVQFDGGDWT